jgi:hypothetical protein
LNQYSPDNHDNTTEGQPKHRIRPWILLLLLALLILIIVLAVYERDMISEWISTLFGKAGASPVDVADAVS